MTALADLAGLAGDGRPAAGGPRAGEETLVVLPTYQEAANVTTVLERVREALPAAAVLVVDDASPDGTADIAAAHGAHVLRRPAKLGLGSAYRDAIGWAAGRGFRFVVAMDADLSHDASRLPTMVAFAWAGADLVIGSRYVLGGSAPGWSAGRAALSRWANRYARVALRLPAQDLTSGFRVYRCDALARLDLGAVGARGFGFQLEIAHQMARAGGHLVEVPITFRDRVAGRSKLSWPIVMEALALVARRGVADRLGQARRVGGRPVEATP